LARLPRWADPDSVAICGGARSANPAVTATFALNVTPHIAVPEQPPDQPVKAEPASGTASSDADEDWTKDTEQVGPQSIPPPPTKPVPVPVFVTVNVNIGGGGGGGGRGGGGAGEALKVADTDLGPVIVTVQVDPPPEQSPPQPAKLPPLSGVSVNVSDVCCFTSAEHVPGQSIEPLVGSGAGAVTCPGPETLTVNSKWSVRADADETSSATPINTPSANTNRVLTTLLPPLADSRIVAATAVPQPPLHKEFPI